MSAPIGRSAAMTPPQSRAPEAPSHRRGGNIESPGHAAKDAQDPEHLGSDEAGEEAQSEESPPVDETDVLSMDGPDSLEEVEDGDDQGGDIDH
jgi:hypothetical protein